MNGPENRCKNCIDDVCVAKGKPSLAVEGTVFFPMLVDDSGVGALGLICSVAGDVEAQSACDNFVLDDGEELLP